MSVGVVILNYNTSIETLELAKKLSEYTCIDYIEIVDNYSEKKQRELIENCNIQKVDFIETGINKGYSYGNNVGLKRLFKKCDYIFITNPDILVEEDCVNQIVEYMQSHSDYAILGAIRKDAHGNYTQRQYWEYPTFLTELLDNLFFGRKYLKSKQVYSINSNNVDGIMDVDVVPGCFFCIRSSILENIEYLDENVFLYYEENILASKIRRIGYKEGIVTCGFYIHNHKNSSNVEKKLKAIKIMLQSKRYFQRNYLELSFLKQFILDLTACIYYIEVLIASLLYVFKK